MPVFHPFQFRFWRLLLNTIVLITLVASLCLVPTQQAQAEDILYGLITLSDTTLRAGGTVVVNASLLTPGTLYHVGMVSGTSFFPGYTTYATANSKGQVYAKITIPPFHTGTHTVAVGLEDDNLLRGKVFTQLSAMQLSVDPASAYPGDTATLTVTNLESGYLSVLIDGKAVIDSKQVASGTLTQSFTVPRGLNTTDTVKVLEAVNQARDVVYGTDTVNLTLLAPRPAVNPQFSGLTITPNPLMPGQKFTITGRLWPLPAGFTPITGDAVYDANLAAGATMLSASFTDNDTLEEVIPAVEIASFSADGNFSVTGTAPDKRFGSAMSVRKNMSAHLTFGYGDSESMADVTFAGPEEVTLTIQTVDINQSPVETEIFITETTPDNPYDDISGATKRTDLLANNNLMDFLCSKDNLKGHMVTGVDGLAHFAARVEDVVTRPVDAMISAKFNSAPAFYNYAQMPGVTHIADPSSPSDPQKTTWIPGEEEWDYYRRYDVFVDGRPYALSYGKTWTMDLPIAVYRETIWVDIRDGTAYNTSHQLIEDYIGGGTLQLYFAPIDLDELGSSISVEAVSPTTGSFTAPGNDYLTYTGFFDLTGITKNNVPTLMVVNYTWDPTSNGELKDVAISFDNDPFPTYVETSSGGGPACPGSDIQNDSQSASSVQAYEVSFPFPTGLSAGDHIVHLRFLTNAGYEFYRDFGLKVESPPGWISRPNAWNKAATYVGDGSYIFSARALNASDKWGEGEGEASANVPNMGQINNAVAPDLIMTQKYQALANGNAVPDALTQLQTEVSGKGLQALSNAPTDAAPDVAQINNMSVQIGPTTVPLAYVAMPVYILAFEDPFGGAIVNGTSGMLVETYAEATFIGNVSSTLIDMTISPYAEVNSQIWLDINILYGVLAQSALTFYPRFSLNMPVNFKLWPQSQEVELGINGVCFGYRGDMYFYFGFLCPPIIGCIVEHEGMVNIYNGSISHGSASCAMRDETILADLPYYGPPIPDANLLERFNASKPLLNDVDLTVSPLGAVNMIELIGTNTIRVQEYERGIFVATREIKTGEGNNNFRQAWLTATTSILAYTDTAYTQAELETATLTAVANSQYIGWMLDDGATQTVPAALTPPNSGDGQVSLASCTEGDAGCPTGGQATAAWVRMKTDDPYKGGYRVGYATYQSGAWNAPALIAAPSGRSDAQPQVIYRGTQPYIYFVRDFDGTGTTTDDRYLFQYKPGDANPTAISAIPGGVVEFSVAVDGDDNPAIAFTRVDASNVGLFDNRHPLYTARGACTGDSCTWTVHKHKDNHARDIYAERPTMNLNPNGEAVVSYRGLGMGPDSNGSYAPYLYDTAGIIHQTGELAQITTLFDGEMTIPDYLTGDGAVYMNVQTAFDRQSGTLITAAVRSSHLSQLQDQQNMLAPDPSDARRISEDSAIVVAARTDQPNFKLDAITAASPYITSSDTITVTVDLHNGGTSWTGSPSSTVAVLATWDGPYGSSTVAATATLSAMESGVATQVSLLVPIPSNPDLTHALYITIAAPASALESTLADNELHLDMGGVPVPQALTYLKAPESPILLLTWQAPSDPRIDHYNVYRSAASAEVELLGSVTGTTFIDSGTHYGQTYAYWVRAVTTSGAESPLSNRVEAAIPPVRIFLPFLFKQGPIIAE